jgi:transposase
MLARTFGCARMVFNDAIRTRQDSHEAGEKISDTETQRRVVTLAKTTPEREWLADVSPGGVWVAKIGDVRLQWSRDLPSESFSVTVIREADGRYYASFVVEVASAWIGSRSCPLPRAAARHTGSVCSVDEKVWLC